MKYIELSTIAKIILMLAVAALWSCGRSGESDVASSVSGENKDLIREEVQQADSAGQDVWSENKGGRESYSHRISPCPDGLTVNGEKVSDDVVGNLKRKFVTFGDVVSDSEIHRDDGFYYALADKNMKNSEPLLACSDDVVLLAAWVCNEESCFHGSECEIRKEDGGWVPMDASGVCQMTDIKIGSPVSFCKKRAK